MAYTKNPTVSTYETKRINFFANPQQRNSDPNKDYRLVNTMVDLVLSPAYETGKKTYIKSRPGMVKVYDTQAAEGRGIYYWVVNGVGHTITAVGNTVYSNGTSVLTLTTTTGHVGFTEFVNSTGTVSLVLLDGVKGYVFSDPSTPVEITSANFPTPHIPTPVFLDAYLFVAKKDTADIYNSDLDDPSLWTAGDFISTEMYPDTIKALSKNNNFLYAVGSTSIEYFYDAANASGSPLARQPSAVQQFGTVALASVVQTEKEVVLLGETSDGGHTVWTIDGFKEHEIAVPAIKSALLAEGSNISNVTAFAVRVSGQKFYVLCLTNRTLVFSFDTKMWSEWKSATGIFRGNYASDGPDGSAHILDRNNGKVYKMNEDLFTDDGVAFTCEITTAKLDFDNINRKFMFRLSLIGDVPDDTLVDSAVQVQWSDNDYKTWSDARTIKFNADLPAIFQLGQFRRRALKISYSLPHLLRLENVEVDINKGVA